MTLAILCSGQGRQHPDMFALTGDAPEAADLFAHAATLLGGRDPREMVQTDTDAAVHQNRVGQILCTLQALAAAAALRDAWPGRLIIAGYSVGEVAAWGVAGLLSATDALDLVARRAEAMDAASAGRRWTAVRPRPLPRHRGWIVQAPRCSGRHRQSRRRLRPRRGRRGARRPRRGGEGNGRRSRRPGGGRTWPLTPPVLPPPRWSSARCWTKPRSGARRTWACAS